MSKLTGYSSSLSFLSCLLNFCFSFQHDASIPRTYRPPQRTGSIDLIGDNSSSFLFCNDGGLIYFSLQGCGHVLHGGAVRAFKPLEFTTYHLRPPCLHLGYEIYSLEQAVHPACNMVGDLSVFSKVHASIYGIDFDYSCTTIISRPDLLIGYWPTSTGVVHDSAI